MHFSEGDRIGGFRVTGIRESREAGGRMIGMIHEKTGAELFRLENGAENGVFAIGFRTLPTDDTGVFHILEHGVLCGSDRYPVREPFVELLKSSMSTFLNAMTFPDMTLFPVSSRNPRDLMNLAGVYLDAVFHPTARKDPKRFLQEGWRIDRDEDGNPVFQGVVYNEMKGSMSDTDTLIERRLTRMLFPDTCYGFNSGGDPEKIPDLTWEQFTEQYDRHYHPSNARVYLDGAVPMEEMLPLLDRVFSEYEKREPLPGFRTQEPRAAEETLYYELGREEKAENRGHLSLGRITGTWADRSENMARGIISDVLTGTNEAPLKRAVLDRKLARDFVITVDDTGYQSWISLYAENVTDGKEAEIRELLRETAEKIRREGLDRNALEASLNRAAYALREEEEPQGIGRCIRCFGRWLYGGDPGEALETEGLIREIREMLDNGRIDELAADMLTETDTMAVLHCRPSATLGAEKREEEARRLRERTEAWTEAERAANERELEELEDWQSAPDPEEALKTLPMLTRKDADAMPAWTETEEDECLGVPVLRHRLACNGVVHLRAYFPLTDRSLEDLCRLNAFTSMLGRLPTRRHDTHLLQQEIKRYTGHFSFSVGTRARKGQDETCTPYLMASVSALSEFAGKALELAAEVLTETEPDRPDRIRDIVLQTEQGVRMKVVSAGHSIGIRSVMSLYSAEGAVRNMLEGEGAVRYIHRFAGDPETEIPLFLEAGKRMMAETVCRKRMTLSVTGTDDVDLRPLAEALPEGTPAPAEAAYRAETALRKGFRIPSQTGFAVRGYRLSRCGVKQYSGVMWLAASILSLDYLWNRIRVRGGAYGAGFHADRSGNLYSYSYRDPTPARTLQADAGAADFLREFARSEEALDKYVISSLNELNPLLSPREKGALADIRRLNGITREESERIRREILNARSADLAACGTWLEQFSKEGAVCVVAHEDALKECEGLEISDL